MMNSNTPDTFSFCASGAMCDTLSLFLKAAE